MKSKSSIFIIIIVVVVIAGGLIYYFAGNSTTPTPTSGLVSTNSGASTGLSPSAASSTAGSQVVTLLKNLSAIQLSDAVFQNPSFSMLTDIGISLPPVTNQGRRNPFAAVGTDDSASATSQTASATGTSAGVPAAKVGSTPSGM